LTPLIIHGAGGHGLVVAETAVAAGFIVVGFVDDAIIDGFLGEHNILSMETVDAIDAEVIVAVGETTVRRRIHDSHVATGRRMALVIHPAASVSPSAQMGCGIFVGPNAVVNAEATVGDGVIINSRAVVEHHCQIGAFSHLAPGSTLGGNVTVGELTLVGIGASVLPDVKIGSNCVVGAGSVVRENVEDGQTVVGSPARPILPTPRSTPAK